MYNYATLLNFVIQPLLDIMEITLQQEPLAD